MTTMKKIALGILSTIMVFCLAFVFVPKALYVDADEAVQDGFYINFSEVTDTSLSRFTDTKEVADGKFILSATELKFMSVDSNNKSSDDGKSFNKRLKMEGEPDGMARTVSFFLEKKAKITVYAYSASSSDAKRKLALYKNGTPGVLMESPELRADGNIAPFTWETTEAGSYYIGSYGGAVNIYYIGVEYTGEAAPVVRNDWAEVVAPSIITEGETKLSTSEDGVYINVPFNGVVGNNGGDYAFVHMYLNDSTEPLMTRRYLPYGNTGSVSFNPPQSGKYSFKVELVRKGVESKFSELANIDFTYNLYRPKLRVKTVKTGAGDLTLEATIVQVNEADYYTLTWADKATGTEVGSQQIMAVSGQEEVTYLIPEGLEKGKTYAFTLTATRTATSETTEAYTLDGVVRNDVERDWQFRYFGTSTKESLNYMDYGGNIYDGLTLHSCSYDEATGVISGQGGKFTYGYFDGISFYYTQIKAKEEDFVLRSKITVDYINAAGNGQEGFALLVRDSIGENGSTDPFYTNSAAAISTKIQQKVGTANVTVKPGIGARFVSGVTDTSGIKPDDTPVQKMYFFDKTIKATKSSQYVFEIEKKNNVYYARYYNLKGELKSEKKMFHTETEDDHNPDNDIDYDPLCQIDKENVYVGFAVARGCVATFNEIDFKVTERSTEYIEIEPEPLTATSSIASPTTSSLPQYNFKFYANSDGIVNVYLNDDGSKDATKLVVKDQEIKADIYFEKIITLTQADNKFQAYFKPTEGWKSQFGEALDFYDEQLQDKLVTYKSYGKPAEALIVAPMDIAESPSGVVGSPLGTGALNDPLDLQTAMNYVLPGQTIYMLEGTYSKTDGNYTVEKGNDGEPGKIKTLRAYPDCKTRPVLDFKSKGGGFTLWGNYWHLKGFDITKTADAKKGLQVGGHYCIVEDIEAYENGDSGIQVSGKSTDLPQFWPAYNLILNCTSYSNRDRAEEDADGFGAKLYCGKGNVFRGCLAYNNADDGWDLYAKTETGAIGQVIIENCITFGNGFTYEGKETKGNGNGFKLGGENLKANHIIRNSISIANKMKGIDSNSCPDIEVYNCTSIYNSKYNYAFYTAQGVNPTTAFKAANNISLLGLSSDNISMMQEAGDEYVLFNEKNYFFYNDNAFSLNGVNQPKGSYNVKGVKLDYTKLNGWKSVDTVADEYDDDIYGYFGVEIDGSGSKGVIKRGNFEKIRSYIYREEDGSLAIKDGYFSLSDTTVTSGTKLEKTPGTHVAPVKLTYKGADGKDAEVVFGEHFNDELQYIAPTDGKPFPNFYTQNNSLTWLWIVLGVVAVAGIGVAVYFLVIRKKKNNKVEEETK